MEFFIIGLISACETSNHNYGLLADVISIDLKHLVTLRFLLEALKLSKMKVIFNSCGFYKNQDQRGLNYGKNENMIIACNPGKIVLSSAVLVTQMSTQVVPE